MSAPHGGLEMELDIVGLVGACSYALDCIEAELVHVTNRHGKRVAYISAVSYTHLTLPTTNEV